jgi:cell division protein FtsQ
MKNVRQRAENYNWTLITGLIFFFSVIITMAVGYHKVVGWLMDEKQVPLRHVMISGDLTYASNDDITAKVMTTDLGSFFNVDVNAVQQRIESLPWVYRVSVRKKWPDILNVHVSEQQSAAIWNDELLLNAYGEVFEAKPDTVPNLPKLYGPTGSSADALKGYQDMSSLLSINGFDVEELTLSARFSWQVMLKRGVLLELGREDKVKRVQRFIDLYEVIIKHNSAPVVSVDLRYDTGMAVRWAEETTGVNNPKVKRIQHG